MADEALENALDRFDLDNLAAHGTMADVLLALKEHKEWVREARRQLAEAKSACFYAFASGAKWWEFHSTKGTMWQSDQHEVEEAAAERYPYVPHLQLAEAKAAREQAEAACAAMRGFIATELNWQGFRSEMLECDFKGTGATAENCRKLADYLKSLKDGVPGQAFLDEMERLEERSRQADLLLYQAMGWMLDHGGAGDSLRIRIKAFRKPPEAAKGDNDV